jgi:hypothetical protein
MNLDSINSWFGISVATDEHHDQCHFRYGDTDLPCYHFLIEDNLKSVEITDPNEHTCNGIWSLAELRATGESWKTIDRVASLMKKAILKKYPR